MDIEQLFKALPRDLQWFILVEFVGSHSVRKGKLIKKMVFGSRHKMVQNYMPKRWRIELVPRIELLIDLPPFEKHFYPSYEYTDKKKEARRKQLLNF